MQKLMILIDIPGNFIGNPQTCYKTQAISKKTQGFPKKTQRFPKKTQAKQEKTQRFGGSILIHPPKNRHKKKPVVGVGHCARGN